MTADQIYRFLSALFRVVDEDAARTTCVGLARELAGESNNQTTGLNGWAI